jgi:hypothetical protein
MQFFIAILRELILPKARAKMLFQQRKQGCVLVYPGKDTKT